MVDINPYGPQCDPVLFSWQELEGVSCLFCTHVPQAPPSRLCRLAFAQVTRLLPRLSTSTRHINLQQ